MDQPIQCLPGLNQEMTFENPTGVDHGQEAGTLAEGAISSSVPAWDGDESSDFRSG